MPNKHGLKFYAKDATKKSKVKFTETALKKIQNLKIEPYLQKYAQIGLANLKDASPIDTGLMASSWDYTIKIQDQKSSIVWTNSDIQHGCNVAILVQSGHATPSGVFVQGVDFINPALEQVFNDLAEQLWKEVVSA